MEVEIQSKKNNPLLSRTEVHFLIRHVGEGTPRRESIRGELSQKLGVGKETIVIDHMVSEFGVEKTQGYAKVYSSVEKAKIEERNYLLKRNNLPMKATKRKEKSAGGKKPAEKPSTSEPAPKKEEKPPAEKKPELKKAEVSEKPVGEKKE